MRKKITTIIDFKRKLVDELDKPDYEHPLALPLWELYRATRLASSHADSVGLIHDDAELAADLHYCAYVLRSLLADRVGLYGLSEKTLQEAREKAELYDGSDGVDYEVKRVFGPAPIG